MYRQIYFSIRNYIENGSLKINTKKVELKGADVYFEDGNKFVITVEEMKYDQELDDKFFTFDTKKHPNVDVIDMR